MEKIVVLGSTGSIGCSTLEVIDQHPESFSVVGLAAGSNTELMIEQVLKYKPKLVYMSTKQAADRVKQEVPSNIIVLWGEDAVCEVATMSEATYVVSAFVGSLGLIPTLAAIRAGKKIGLANKETLVMAGHLVMEEVKKNNVTLLPIDSEHSALFQCLSGESKGTVSRLILTASGGAFRTRSRDELAHVSVSQALNHPNWSMGKKVTIDSATLMNKGLEVIEAHWLFDFSYDQIDVVIHPQSIVHSLVEYIDGGVIAQLGIHDMKLPIQYALSYPKRLSLPSAKLGIEKMSELHFYQPNRHQYPCLEMAYQAGRAGGTMPTVLNAANEVAVELFLTEQISFLQIEEIVDNALQVHQSVGDPSLEEIQEADRWARTFAQSYLINR